MASYDNYEEKKERQPSVAVEDTDLRDLPEYQARRESVIVINELVAEDQAHDIKLRTMSWHKAAWLLCGDQVCLAIMAQTWSLSVLGWVPGIITMVGAGILFWITSMTMHKFIMRYPQIKDICDFAYYVSLSHLSSSARDVPNKTRPAARARSHTNSPVSCYSPTTLCSSASTFSPARRC